MTTTRRRRKNETPPTAVDAASNIRSAEPKFIFNSVWKELEVERGRENLRFPKELILLGGAPGAGKGTQTAFILNERGLTCDSIVVSSLLNSPEMTKIKDSGGLVGDREVLGLVLRELLKPEYRDGAVLDGFPRTEIQVECLKMLVDRMTELRREYHATPLGIHFRQPTIRIMVLYVSEEIAVQRQLKRGLEILEHNRRVRETGEGVLLEERVTDTEEATARRRYKVFKEQTWSALQSLREHYSYHFVDGEGTVEQVQHNILHELQYQSSLELDPSTYEALCGIPLASEITQRARIDLVRRLDSYEFDHPDLFRKVAGVIQEELMPIIQRHAISGHTRISTENPIFEDPLALSLLIDIFSERGFRAFVEVRNIEIPDSVDLQTGRISCRVRRQYHLHVLFAGSDIRRK